MRRCIVGLPKNGSTQYAHSHNSIWISDAILEQQLSRFCRLSKRYGSNVPGPLEARRRANKRRNTYLASHDLGRAPIEPALVLGTDKRYEWWQNQAQSEPAPELSQIPPKLEIPSFLPDWLSPLAPVPVLIQRTPTQTEKISASEEQELTLFERAQEVKDISQLHALLQDHEQEFAHNATLRGRLFRALATTPKHNYQILQDFLFDSALNKPEDNNYMYLVDRGFDVSRPMRWKSLELFAKNVQFGTVSDAALEYAVTGIDHLGPPQVGKKHQFWDLLYTSIRQSDVLSLTDLPKSLIRDWLTKIEAEQFTYRGAILAWDLRTFAERSDDEALQLLLRLWVASGPASILDMTRFLTALPTQVLEYHLRAMTTYIMGTIDKADAISDLFIQWKKVLRSLRKHSFSSPSRFLQAAWQSHCSESEVSKTELSQAMATREAVVIDWWIVRNAFDKSSRDTKEWQGMILERFTKAFDIRDEAAVVTMVDIFLTAKRLRLPGISQLLYELRGLTGSLLTFNSNPDYVRNLETDGSNLIHRHQNALLDDDSYRRSMRSLADPLRKLSQDLLNNVSRVKSAFTYIILEDRLFSRVVQRLLRHNRRLHLALPHSWPGPTDSIETSKTTPFPKQALELISHLALAYSVSPAFTPRGAYHRVYHLYLYLHRYEAPITQAMVRALWYAGMTRYIETGTSSDKGKWIIKQVEAVEGTAVAEKLLLNVDGTRAAWRKDVHEMLQRGQSPMLTSPGVWGESEVGPAEAQVQKSARKYKPPQMVQNEKGHWYMPILRSRVWPYKRPPLLFVKVRLADT